MQTPSARSRPARGLRALLTATAEFRESWIVWTHNDDSEAYQIASIYSKRISGCDWMSGDLRRSFVTYEKGQWGSANPFFKFLSRLALLPIRPDKSASSKHDRKFLNLLRRLPLTECPLQYCESYSVETNCDISSASEL